MDKDALEKMAGSFFSKEIQGCLSVVNGRRRICAGALDGAQKIGNEANRLGCVRNYRGTSTSYD
jgi:hypothetical protein